MERTVAARHAAVELDDYLAYMVMRAVIGQPYKVYVYNKGVTQARDQFHSRDVTVGVLLVCPQSAILRSV